MPSWPPSLFRLGRRVHHALRPTAALAHRYAAFRRFLALDEAVLRRLAALQGHLLGEDPADEARLLWLAQEAARLARRMAAAVEDLDPALGQGLAEAVDRVAACLPAPTPWPVEPPYLLPLAEAGRYPGRCGGKAAGLGWALELGAPVPPGLVLTAQAFGLFVTATGVDAVIRRHLRVARCSDPEAVTRACAAIQEAILGAELPEPLPGLLAEAAARLGPGPLAVRSSAVAEDGEDSFAGQYASELGVAPADLAAAVRRVYAGKYCPRAVLYRMRRGLTDVDTAMAVLLVPMVPARAAGVVYTQQRQEDGSLALAVHAVAGLGARLVEGLARPSCFVFSRTDPPVLVRARHVEATALTEAHLPRLVRLCLCLEEVWGQPLDVEWALGPDGPVVLQARPMRPEGAPAALPAPPHGPMLAEGLDLAAPGLGCGPVFVAAAGQDVRRIPAGAVVATPSLAPALSAVVDRVAAIVAEHGSRASHLATVAREWGVPVVVGLAPAALPAGEVVTVDGFSGRILPGCQAGAVNHPRDAVPWPRQRWEPLAAATVRLTCTDPAGPGFTPAACQSLHDTVRVAHEGAVAAMLELGSRRGLGAGQRLRLDAPFALYVVDVGQGLAGAPRSGEVAMEHLACAPLRAVLDGMVARPGQWGEGVFFADWAELDRVAGGLVARDSRLLASFALVDADYVHLGLRLGYHFSRIDALACPRVEANYVRLSLEGGGGAAVGQGLRQELVRRILETRGFTVEIRGERLVAVQARVAAQTVLQSCRLLGRLVVGLRLGDAALREPADVEAAVARFWAEEA